MSDKRAEGQVVLSVKSKGEREGRAGRERGKRWGEDEGQRERTAEAI